MVHAERGLNELRSGRPLLVIPGDDALPAPQPSGNGTAEARPADPGPQPVVAAAVDGLEPRRLAELREWACGPLRLVVTHHRGRALGLGVRRPTSLRLPSDADARSILELSSARGKAIAPAALEGAEPRPASLPEAAALDLARLGRLLPAVVVAPADPAREGLRRALASGTLLQTTPAEVHEFEARTGVEVVRVSEAPVPLAAIPHTRFILFRETPSLLEHVAILVGPRADWPDPVPVRLHSACLTGDLFGSLRCDCGEQLQGSLEYFDGKGGGVLLYLAQEGRGIGLGNKLRAYTMQEGGLDTVEADQALGFGPDERGYGGAVKILEALEVGRIELLTNNPDKMAAVERAGIEVVERRGLHGRLNAHNLPYMEAKAEKAGHLLESMLEGGLPDGDEG